MFPFQFMTELVTVIKGIVELPNDELWESMEKGANMMHCGKM